MTRRKEPIFPTGHPVVTPEGDGRLLRSWQESRDRIALVRLESGETWEGYEEELGDGTIDPNSLCQFYGICDNPAVGERYSAIFEMALPICAEHLRQAEAEESNPG